MSLYEYDVAESDSITAGDMVAVNEGGEVEALRTARAWYQTRPTDAQTWQARNRAMAQDDGPPQGKYERARAWMDRIGPVMSPGDMETTRALYAREMARMGEGSPDMPDAVQPLSGGDTIIFRDGTIGRVMSVEGRNVSVQMEGVLTSVTANVRIDDDRTDAMFFTIDGRTETIPVSRPRPDHELRILRALDLARLHRVTVADLRERARVRALSDSALPLDAPSGGLCKGRYRATRSQVCDDTRVRCRGALGLYAPHPRDRAERQWEPCISQRVWLSYEYPYVRWRCTTLRLTGMVSL